MNSDKNNRKSNLIYWSLVIVLLAFGLGIRLYDITDPPFDYHTTRQFRGAVIARGMYYQMLPEADPELRSQAIDYWNSVSEYEPQILERLTALTYLIIGSEYPWIANIYNSIFWVIGGLALIALAKRMFPWHGSPWIDIGGTLLALGYYLFLPFSVQASRAFLPDPGMTVLVIFSLYFIYRWIETFDWKYALVCGLLSGMAMLYKVTAFYIIAPVIGFLALKELGYSKVWKNTQVWIIGLLMVIPTIVFSLTLPSGHASTYFENTTFSLLYLFTKPSFYLSWFHFVQSQVGLSVLFLSIIGLLITSPRNRLFFIAIWIGYILYGGTFPYQIYTHNYYHLRLVPILALSLVPVTQLIVKEIAGQKSQWKFAFSIMVIFGLGYSVWLSYFSFSKSDYRDLPAYWHTISTDLPKDGKIIALTQDYGFPLMYYGWRKVYLWPIESEQRLRELRQNVKEFDQVFYDRIKGKRYFLITDKEQLDAQTELKDKLINDYYLLQENNDFILFDLKP